MTKRSEVYAAIDSERKYVDELPRHLVHNQTPMEHLAIIEWIVLEMKRHNYECSGQPPMDYMRKIAATAVYCMEQHGAPKRNA